MENQSTGPLDSTQINTAPINQSTISTQKKSISLVLLTALVSAVVFGFGGYYFGSSQYQQALAPETSTVSPTPTAQQTSNIPSDWSYKTNNECGVQVPIPPKSAPYLGSDGKFWDFPRGATYPNLLSKVLLENQEYKHAITMYASADEASGNIAQAVSITCIPNDGRFIDNEQLLAVLTDGMGKYNSSDEEKGMQPPTYLVVSNNPTQRWNKEVLDLLVKEELSTFPYTIFMTPQFIYEVKVFGSTEDDSVKNVAKQIFDNLKF